MKVFISWSGDRSKAIAEALYDWLPTIVQSLEPWMSQHDIDKGTRAIPAIAQELELTQFGIICLTNENVNAPWLLFEAGALSKSQDQSRVWTFLYQMEQTDVRGPLAQFQHTRAERADIKALVHAINIAQGDALISEQQLEVAFERGWPELDAKLQAIPDPEQTTPERSEKDMIKELLELTRSQVAERRQSSYEADKFITSFLPLLVSALQTDSKYSENVRSWQELNRTAFWRLMARESDGAKSRNKFFDPAAGSSNFMRNSSNENKTDITDG